MFNLLKHLFTSLALERTLKESDEKIKELQARLDECEQKCEILNKRLQDKTPAYGVMIDPPEKKHGGL